MAKLEEIRTKLAVALKPDKIEDTITEQAMTYPLTLMSQANIDRPVVFFESEPRPKFKNEPGARIFLPPMSGLNVSGGANYDGQELGLLGSAASNAISSTIAGDRSLSNLAGGLLSEGKAIAKDAGGVGALIAKSLTGGDSALGNAISIATGVVKNPHLTTDFNGVGVRSWGFVYKLVANSKKEADVIAAIVKAFHRRLYPHGNRAVLHYPPKWTIKFLEGPKSRKELTDVPKIFQCYLREFTATYNSTTNTWREDGTPLETDINMTFVETRALTAEDIEKLETQGFSESRFQGIESIPIAEVTQATRAGIVGLGGVPRL